MSGVPRPAPTWANAKTPSPMKLALALLSSLFLGSAALGADVPANYPLKKCVISDETLGEHGKPVKVTHEGTDVYLCCKACIKDFKKNPGKYTSMVKNPAKK
jgi:YHS domain-containing protein